MNKLEIESYHLRIRLGNMFLNLFNLYHLLEKQKYHSFYIWFFSNPT